MTFAIIVLALFTTALGRYLVASRGGDFGHEGRARTAPESALVWLSVATCVGITAEHLFDLGPWLTEPSAPWTAVPALLWTLGMVAVSNHPLDRSSMGVGFSATLPHVYQGLLGEIQMPATPLAAALLVFTAVWCWRRGDGSEG